MGIMTRKHGEVYVVTSDTLPAPPRASVPPSGCLASGWRGLGPIGRRICPRRRALRRSTTRRNTRELTTLQLTRQVLACKAMRSRRRHLELNQPRKRAFDAKSATARKETCATK